MRVGFFSLFLVLMGCTDLEQAARDELAGRDYVDIQLQGADGAYTFQAKRSTDGHHCDGTVGINSSKGLFSSSSSAFVIEKCRPAPGPVELSLPETLTESGKTVAMDCDQGKGDACSDLGYAFENGKHGLEKDLVKALSFYEKACEMDSGMGCTNAAISYKKGEGTDANPETGHGFNVKACDMGYEKGCRFVAIDLYEGIGVSVDKKKAYAAFHRGCELGDGLSCANEAVLLFKGEGARKDNKAAAARSEKGCRLGAPRSCAVYGGALFWGEGVPKDQAKARELVNKACADGSELGCERQKKFAK